MLEGAYSGESCLVGMRSFFLDVIAAGYLFRRQLRGAKTPMSRQLRQRNSG